MKSLAAALLFMGLPLVAIAADEASEPKFIPLDSARNGRAGQGLVSAEPQVKTLRSDSQAMSNGFFRLDRRSTMVNAAPKTLLIPAERPAAPGMPVIIRGPATPAEEEEPAPLPDSLPIPMASTSNDPVLSLFDIGSKGGSALPSFRSALNNRSGSLASEVTTSIHHSWPLPASVPQRLSSAYGDRAHPISHAEQFHGGIDIAAAPGTPVLATAAGEVTRVGSDDLYGKSITLQHQDGSISQYGHLSAQQVQVGDHVRAGQAIGAVGATGRVTGPHLDYRLSKEGFNFAPLAILDRPSSVTVEKVPAPEKPQVPTISSAGPPIQPKSERLIMVR